MASVPHRLRSLVTDFVGHGTDGAAPQKALLIRRARGFGLVAFVVLLNGFAITMLQGQYLLAGFSLASIVVYASCVHVASRQRGRWAEPAGHVAIGFLLAMITLTNLEIGGAPSSSVTYPSLLLLGTTHVLGVRAAAFWTVASVLALAWVVFTATLPPPSPGIPPPSPPLLFVARSFVLFGIFAIAAVGRRTEDQQTEQLQFLARHDPLTGLCNRREIEERLAQSLARAARYENRPALLFIDLDDLKQVNDEYGHAVGDDVLRAIARALSLKTRQTDTAGRMGGDEFVVVLEDAGDEKNAERYATRLLGELNETDSEHVAPIRVGASIGIALFPEDGADVDTLTRSADAAMYRAKRAGGNRIHLAAEERGDRESPAS